MNALFAFAILSASAVFSSPVPAKDTDIDTELKKHFDDWGKNFPDLKFQRPKFNFLGGKDDDSDTSVDADPLSPGKTFTQIGFPSDFLKDIRDRFANATNNTVENTREVDGHVIHEKESTYSNSDPNNRFVFTRKTVVIRPKDDVEGVERKHGTEERTFNNHPKPVEYLPKFPKVSVNPFNRNNPNNPDDDVEMVKNRKKGVYNEAIREGNSIDNNDYVVDLSKDTRINDFYDGPIEPKAVIFDANAKSKKYRRRENPKAQITELSSNHLEEDKNKSAFLSLEHDTDVNAKSGHLKIEKDAETIDTNAIRKKRKNSYPHT